MNEIYEYVKEINENVVVAVYCDRTQPCKCSVGYIRCINKSHIVLKHIDTNGLEDGYVLRNFNDIYRIDSNGKYENYIEKKYKRRGIIHEEIGLDANKDLLMQLLCIALDSNKIVSISMLDEEVITGYVDKIIEHNGVVLRSIDMYGECDGNTIIYMSDIQGLNYDSFEHRK